MVAGERCIKRDKRDISFKKRALLYKLCKRRKRNMYKHSSCLSPSCCPINNKEAVYITKFRQWCSSVGIELNKKVYIGHEGSCHEIGILATDTIMKDEVIATIPRTAVLTARNSVIANELLKHDTPFQSLVTRVTPWIPLLIALTIEYAQSSDSRWEPYLSLVPNNGDCPPPLLWEQNERETLLQGTCVSHLVQQDIRRISKDYTTIVEPLYKRHTSLIPEEFHSQKLYEKSVSFVMSYSFTDANRDDPLSVTMMIPFVDLLNHHDNHNAELLYHSNYVQLVAVKNIEKGQEVFNTFGRLPNYSLLHSYGFVIPNNRYDAACVLPAVVKECYLSLPQKPDNATKRWEIIRRKGIILHSYEVDNNGVPEKDLLRLIRLLLCNKFILKLSGKWSITFNSLNIQERNLLTKLMTSCIHLFPQSLKEGCGSSIGLDKEGRGSLNSREEASLLVSIGSLTCLQKCLKLLEQY